MKEIKWKQDRESGKPEVRPHDVGSDWDTHTHFANNHTVACSLMARDHLSLVVVISL